MLALLSANTLFIYNNTSLKQSTSTSTSTSSSLTSKPELQLDLDVLPSSITWAPDGAGLYLTAEGSIRRYSSTGLFEKVVCCPSGLPRSLLASADGAYLYFASRGAASQVRISDGEIRELHRLQSPVAGISLSNDGKHLALYSETECVIHNLSSSTSTSIGLSPELKRTITACVFHTQIPTRLLVGHGPHLLIYDVLNPQTPKKSIDLSDRSLSKSTSSNNDNIICVANSHFSENLVAVGLSVGTVNLVETRKGKIIDKIDVKESITCLDFTSNGSSLLVGTNDGKLLILNLRALHSPRGIRTIIPNKLGVKITALAILKVPRASSAAQRSPHTHSQKLSTQRPPRKSINSPLTPRDTNLKPPTDNLNLTHKSTRSSPLSVSSANKSPNSPRNRRVTRRPTPYTNLNTSTSLSTNTPLKNPPKKAFEKSPQVADLTASVSGSSLDVSIQLETLPSPPTISHRRIGTAAPKIKSNSFRAQASPRSRLRMMVTAAAKENAVKDRNNTFNRPSLRIPPTSPSRMVKGSSKTNRAVSSSSARNSISSSTFSTKTRDNRNPGSLETSTSTVTSGTRNPTEERDLEKNLSSISVPEISFDDFSNEPSSISEIMDDKPATTTTTMMMMMKKRERKNVRGAQALHEEVCSPDDIEAESEAWTPTPPLNLSFSTSLSQAHNPARESQSLLSTTENEKKINNPNLPSLNELDANDPLASTPKSSLSPFRAPTTTSKALQLTPARVLSIRHSLSLSPLGHTSPSTTSHNNTFPQLTSSPSHPSHPSTSTPTKTAALQTLLTTLLKPVLEDLHKEQHAQILGLHLDMLRMGREVKREVREIVGGALSGGVGAGEGEGGVGEGVGEGVGGGMGELGRLREENRRLRVENERLRRRLEG